MKIGIYSPYLDTLTGGEKYIFTMASCLSREHSVYIFWDDNEILDKASRKFKLDLARVKLKENIFKKGALKRYLETLKYDRFVYLSDGSLPIVGSKKLIIHFQFPIEWVDVDNFSYQFKKKLIYKVICNSNYTKSFIDRKFKIESSVLYPPAEINTENNIAKKNTILTVGRFNRLSNGSDFKKLSILVKAFKMFQKKRLKGWELKILTSVRFEDEKEFEKFEKSINSNSIKIYRNAIYEDVKQLYKEAKIYWHAAGFGEDLNKHPERAEHFGISTVEAMSYGSVPIVINAGGQKEIVKHYENGFLWETIEDLVNLTHKVAVDDKLRKSISERAIETSHNFSRARFCDDVNHIIW